MEYMEFRRQLTGCLEQVKEEGEQIEWRQVTRNNGISRDGLLIRCRGRNMSPVFPAEELKRRYEEGESLARIAQMLVAESRLESRTVTIFPEFWNQYGRVRGEIRFRIVGRERNRKLLETHPHTEVLDLAVIYEYPFLATDRGCGRILVRREDLDRWGIDEETLHEDAMRNTPLLEPEELLPIREILSPPGSVSHLCPEAPAGAELYVLTNHSRLNGASAMLYDGVLKGFAETHASAFFILPSSLHEVLLLPDEGRFTAAELEDFVQSVNRDHVLPEDVLSGRIYRYEEGGGLRFA